MPTWVPYPDFVNPGDNAWQMTAATLVGLMSVPGLAVLYGGVMQKRWSVNSMMMAFVAFALVLVVWVLYGFKMAFGAPMHIFGADTGFFSTMWGKPGSVLGTHILQEQAAIPRVTTGPAFNFGMPSLIYFQFVFAAITPILMLGSVLGRISFRAWMPLVVLWSSVVYTVNAFLIWGGGFWSTHGALDYSGGYVIHLAAGVSGFVAAAVIGPRLQRDREIDAPNNLLMVATGAGLLWMGWNGFNGGDMYYAGANASVAVLNTNLACAVAFLSWIACDYATGHKPSLISGVNGIITGLVLITPGAGFINGWGAMAIGIIGGVLVYFALNYLSRVRPFRNVDDTLGVVYTHGFAGLLGGLLLGFVADPNMIVYTATGGGATSLPGIQSVFNGGSWELLKDQAETGLWVICFSALGTFILLKIIGLFVSLRIPETDLEEGDIAIHGHEVYPSDVPSLAYPSGAQGS